MKRSLRKKIVLKRDLLSPEEIKIKSNFIVKDVLASEEYIKSKRLFCFLSFGSEVDTEEILRDALKTKEVYVPYINKTDDLMYPVLIKDLNNFIINKFGIREPEFDEKAIIPDEFDLVIVPGVSFDREGWRIGYGKGYYDKFFKKYNVKNKTAVAFDLQLVDKVSFEDHDIPVDLIITEDEIIKV